MSDGYLFIQLLSVPAKTETVISPIQMSSGKTLTFAQLPDLRLKMPPPER